MTDRASMTGRRLKIAIMGTRGVPPAYGGFETFAAELGTRLVTRGHQVAVYSRAQVVRGAGGVGGGAGPPGHPESSEAESKDPYRNRPRGDSAQIGVLWRGLQRLVVPAVMGSKYLETVSHTFLSALDAVRRDFDAVLLCNAANAFVLPLLRAARIPVAINVDGIERKRRKWNALGRAVYGIGESFSVVFANAVVADADVIAGYYRTNYATEPVTIPYGAEFPDEADSDVLLRLGLERRSYILYVSRAREQPARGGAGIRETRHGRPAGHARPGPLCKGARCRIADTRLRQDPDAGGRLWS